MTDDLKINASDEALEGLGRSLAGEKPDFTLTRAHIESMWDDGMCIHWETVSAGFGELTLYRDDQGQWAWDTEGMNRKFVSEVLGMVCRELLEKLGQ